MSRYYTIFGLQTIARLSGASSKNEKVAAANALIIAMAVKSTGLLPSLTNEEENTDSVRMSAT